MNDSPFAARPMTTIKKRDDKASREFWDSVEEAKKDWQSQRPSWFEELEERQQKADAAAPEVSGRTILCD